ncbi:lipoyl synthase [candidate division WOR-1 bacterium RIFOXYA12_FULL_43_27]|uniref:Lipoyl synthase n=1 Tax=candidate division WOR-1 bacterium RIFOXYC2_FULL_46_14 TaxID=1802587 RepID=A0A1F4U8K0_UNCSA|nr:MAG: lipoyl synthase [candidate division WOR-1 bacterium RIFOXYA12_FULL_43_27]OGC19558.1 MAG: lipoyl synthase [candidate division WOR-1 bacterium RIFOXYB2_FULL_46_45]OGC30546.1 MAG: lipoyl synthase [candidate division WOR-1 bacterium RIFOXYA2_FULL_46_56]OGC40613.1 MAG: lipoyl synthase [candidate division WOR-1 bacterium RIFOXYC2_FULL_46_14]
MALPDYLIKKAPKSQSINKIRALLGDPAIHTVCESAKCPNIGECFSKNTLTFMILGKVCTRSCAFCGVGKGAPQPVDPDEPEKIREAVLKLGLDYVVVTSVTRDDLPDFGAEQFARVITALSGKKVEVLIPDFQGDEAALQKVIDASPLVINHNVETIPSLYRSIRPQAVFERSLELLLRVKKSGICAKSGFMVGLGEEDEDVFNLILRLNKTGLDMVTIGQYLPPSRLHPKPKRFVAPEKFMEYKVYGESLGIKKVEAGPFVRSSFHAEETWKKLSD